MTEIARIKIEYRLLGSLKLNPRNARLHSDNQVAEIARSISRFGFLNPLLVDSDGTIIAGEGRYLAARKLGLLEAPVI
ncbi:ParB/Srx family N-terminal domain-containing protein, partial [Bradyrhizobium japonicum]